MFSAYHSMKTTWSCENHMTCLNNRASQYLADDCCWARCRRPGTRSAKVNMPDVPRARKTFGFGDRSFAIAGPQIWNSLPLFVRDQSQPEHTCLPNVCRAAATAPVMLNKRLLNDRISQWWANHKSNQITMSTKWQQFQTLYSMCKMSSMYIWPDCQCLCKDKGW